MRGQKLVENGSLPRLSVRFCGFEACKSGHRFGPAVRLHYLIHYVESGKGVFRVGGKEYALGAGDLFVIEPFLPTDYEADGDDPWHDIWIGFDAEPTLPVALPKVLHLPRAASVFARLKELARTGEGGALAEQALLWQFFSLVEEKKAPPRDAVSVALDRIHTEYMNPLTVGELARQVGLDRSWFSSRFKARTGLSPGQYLLSFRLELAAELMQNHGQSVKCAANSVGYEDLYHFSRMFRRHFGLSPRAWRQKNAKENLVSEKKL